MSYTTFQEGTLPPEAFDVERFVRNGMTLEAAEWMVERNRNERVYLNNVFQVHVIDARFEGLIHDDKFPDMWHLSIRRRDRRLIRDWRALQWIKNELIGPEHDGCEVFPAEDRLIDTADQWHLFVFKDPEVRWPFGWIGHRLVGNEGDKLLGIDVPGATQRPRPAEHA